MPTTLPFTHTLPPQLTHYFSGDLGTLSLGIPYNTCNATKVARETTGFFFFFFFFSKLQNGRQHVDSNRHDSEPGRYYC